MTCRFVLGASTPEERRCWKPEERYGYCREHLALAPEEIQATSTLQAKLTSAREALNELGEFILKEHVFPIEETPIPEELRREYRALWYRHNYLMSVRNERRPGDPLPAEVTKQ